MCAQRASRWAAQDERASSGWKAVLWGLWCAGPRWHGECSALLGHAPAINACMPLHMRNDAQELVTPSLLEGKNAVIAAETGSGKTLSYVAPIASLMLRQKKRLAEANRCRARAEAASIMHGLHRRAAVVGIDQCFAPANTSLH